MIALILLLLILLWLTGNLNAPLFTLPAFSLGGRSITFNDILVFLVILWLIGILPRPFREVAMVVFLLWILSSIGIIAIAGLPTIILLALIFGVIAYMAEAV